jgi:outer membrane protein
MHTAPEGTNTVTRARCGLGGKLALICLLTAVTPRAGFAETPIRPDPLLLEGADPVMEDDGEDTIPDGWAGYVGLGVSYGPVFPGSDDSEVSVALDVDLTWRERFFLRSDIGVGAYLLNSERTGGPVSLGLALGYDIDERLSEDDPRLTGLDDVEAGAAARFLFEYEVGLADLEVVASRGLGSSGHEGTTVEASLGFGLPVGERTVISAAPFLIWADSTYMDAFYGISPSESASSGYAPYSPGGGLQQAGLEFSAAYFLTERAGLFGQIEYGSLLGDAKDSPITFEDTFLEVSLGVVLRF